MARLGDIFEIQITGEWGSECTENETGTKVLRTTNFTPEGRINYDDVVVRSINESKVEKKRLYCGDIILEKSGGTEKTPVGRVVFCDESIEESTYLCNNFTQAMRVNQAIAIPRYVFYFMWNLHCSGRTDLLQNKTTGIRNLQVKSYLNEECPLPPLDEQHKIAAVLDKVSSLIAKRRTQLDKLDELVKSRFIEMFGDVTKNEKNWSTRKISEIATLQSGGTPSRQFPKYFEGTIPWITTVALGKNAIGIEDAIEYITEEAIENSATKLIPKNSLLFGIRVGVGKVSENIVPMCINQDIVAIIINDRYKLNMLFLKNLLDMFSGYFNSQKRGATIQGIKSEVLKNISVSLPPIELQNQFADFVKQTDKSKLAIQKNLEKLEILKKSLMQKYFD